MSASHVMGRSGKLYYNTVSHAVPTWVEITGAGDVNVPMSKGLADISSRLASWRAQGAGLKEASIEFDYLHQGGTDTVFDALLASYISDTVREYAVMDGSIATQANQGLRAYCLVSEMSQGQAMEEGMKFSFVLVPTRFIESSAVVAPDWFEVP